ncbi:MAG: VCBS repeat-containing protein, partial [Myxococcales bacterium]|nr:VCBS repeat-containing protein [Myxococcales bacterium]
ADYDRDGDLDVYLLTNRVYGLTEALGGEADLKLVDGKPVVPPELAEHITLVEGRPTQAGQADRLYENDGRGHFVDVTKKAGIAGYDMGLSATWWDFDADGYLDLYVGNDMKTPDRLYHNRHDGTFEEVVAQKTARTPWFSMGADVGDVNNDGLMDLFVADMAATTHFKEKATMGNMGSDAWFLTAGVPRQFMRNALYLNTGTMRLLEASFLAGVSRTDWTWSVRFGDLDNDGRIDLHVTNGMARMVNDSDIAGRIAALRAEGKKDEAAALESEYPAQKEANMAFRNEGDLQFQPVGARWGLDEVGVSHGAVLADLDRDGDLDVVVNNLNAPVSVYRNDGGNGHRLLVELRDAASANRFGLGALVTVEAGGERMTRRLLAARGYLSSDEPVLHFGLGEASEVDKLTILWPDGSEQVLEKLKADQAYRIEKPTTGLAKYQPKRPAPPLFVPANQALGLEHKHEEIDHDDFAAEPLLPLKLSQLGPAVAWGDVDGDGKDDLFVTGARGKAGALYLRHGGKLSKKAGPWEEDVEAEDVAALLFDADGDGDLDLYLGAGSNEVEPGADAYVDRLYLGDGEGGFTRAEKALPKRAGSTGAVVAADFDRDGDLDLFVGERMVPRRYPVTPTSRLLENRDGRFVDVTKDVAPDLAEVGLVSGALWSDHDGDGWLDLVLALDWGPVAIFANREGKLEDVTEDVGLARVLGWWHGIAAGDVDGDGDVDFLATNLGLNTKYAASSEHPLALYYDDFDGSGSLDLLEASYEEDKLFPMRGRSCSSRAMPFIADKFATFAAFAEADMATIYSEEALEKSPVRRATELQSVLLLNDGKGKLEVKPLPRLAQISPGFGVVMSDFDGDGALDGVIAQNFFTAQPETGLLDGGVGLFLRGDGRGGLSPVWPKESGFIVPNAATAATVVDLDDDGHPDLTVATNNGYLQAFLGKPKGRHLALTLVGKGKNRAAIGARATLELADGRRVAQEVSAGSGYASQSSSTLFFGSAGAKSLTIRWPDGSESKVADGLEGKKRVEQP